MEAFFKATVIAFEAAAVTMMISGAVLSSLRFIKRTIQKSDRSEAYQEMRKGFGRSLLVSLDFLVAADIILTVALDLSYQTLGMLGLLVIIRTFLHFVLDYEVNGTWPWQNSVHSDGRER